MKALYQYDVCRAEYSDVKHALACEAQGTPTNIKVGDIVKKHDDYGWHTGPDHWIMFDTGKFHDISTRDFYWLVLDIQSRGHAYGKHCNEVTCVSRGVVNGASVDGERDWGIQRFNHYLDPNYSRNYPVVAEDVPQLVRDEAEAFMKRGYTVDPREVKVTTKKG